MISPKFIKLGNNVNIGHGARIHGVPNYLTEKFNPLITLGNNLSIQQNLHLTCANSVKIGSGTAIAANVTITDIHHQYTDISTPIERQPITVKSVNIGCNCKIYNNVVVLPGVSVGNHVSIGANSVVTKDIPDYCVAIGSPARIVKRYNSDTKSWDRTNPDGSFRK